MLSILIAKNKDTKILKLNILTTIGRKFVDAAFLFALAGVTDVRLFDMLYTGALAEIKRFGHRRSCRCLIHSLTHSLSDTLSHSLTL